MMTQFERIRAEVENYSAQETSSFQTSSSLRTDPFNAFPAPETSESQSEGKFRKRHREDLDRRRRAQERSREAGQIQRDLE